MSKNQSRSMKLEELKEMLTFPLQHRYASSFDLFDKLEQQIYSSVRTPAGEIFEEKDKYIIKLEDLQEKIV